MALDAPGSPGPAGLRALALAASGAAGALAFPSTDWWPLGWVWLVPALAAAVHRAPRGALADGWLAGTAFFAVLLSWLDHTFRHYSAIPWPVSWLPILLLSAYCGLYVGLTAGAVSWLGRRIGSGWALAAAPAVWVAGEWIRGRLMDGFPWGLLGYSQHSVPLVIQVAELAGVYGVSFVLVAASSALAGAAALGARRSRAGLGAVALLVAATLGWGAVALDREESRAASPGPAVRVGVIQPSIEQSNKWDPARHAEQLMVFERLTRAAAGARPALIIWPETAATIFLRGDPALLERLRRLADETGARLVVGSIDRPGGTAGKWRNSAFLLTEQGITGKYDKIHLVPFGEYVPLAGLIGFVRSWAEFISDFEAGDSATVLALPGSRFGTVICYEVVFPELFREFVTGGASFMVNITNDAWFGRTSGPWQHLGMLPLRAVEHRVAIARSANTGVSAFVSPTGRVTRTLALFEQGVLGESVPLRRRTTLYTRFGDWLAYASLAVTALVAGIGARRGRRAGC
jgi:apolipoprotein N-acyltransferase